MKRILLVFSLVLPVLATVSPASAVITTVGTTALAVADFNGDGVSDLASGVRGEEVGGQAGAGAVNVIYGKANGLSAQGDQIVSQDSVLNSTPIVDTAQEGDAFGSALAAGDFDGDGFDDLAVGVPNEDPASEFDPDADAGAVNVIYGSASGLTGVGNQFWTQATAGLDAAEGFDFFGRSLAAANFGKGARDDLAVGAPGETIAGDNGSGSVGILYGAGGTPGGLNAAGSKFLHQNVAGVPGDSEPNDNLGRSLAAGDFGKTDHADLAAGAYFESIDVTPGGGAVTVFYGSANGIKVAGSQMWHEDVPDIVGQVSPYTSFGWALAAGNFGRGRRDDIAIGAPEESVGGASTAGTVHVIYGSSSGLRSQGNAMWHEGRPGILSEPLTGEFFGSTLAAANFGKSGLDDLAVSAPKTDSHTGLVHAIYGGKKGLSAAGDQVWSQDSPGISDDGEPEEYFGGGSLAAGDMGKSSKADLAIGTGLEDIGSAVDAGADNVIYGSATGLRSAGDQFWHQNVPGIEDQAATNEVFGGGLF